MHFEIKKYVSTKIVGYIVFGFIYQMTFQNTFPLYEDEHIVIAMDNTDIKMINSDQ